MQRHIIKGLLAGAVILTAGAVHSQTTAEAYPTKLVRIVVPYTPGGATDAVARSIASRLSEKWKKPVIVENRSGASGIIGTSFAAKATADGYTLLLSDSAPFVILPTVSSNLPYAPLTDFAPIAVVAKQIPVLVVSAKLPVTTVKEFLAYLKAHPNTPYASLGDGSYPHVAMEEFQRLTGQQMLHIPYKGTAQVITDMISGEIQAYIGTLGAFQQYDKDGRVRILAVATEKRQPLKPEMPTISEAGVPGFSVDVWFGLVAPAGTPSAILEKIQHDVNLILKDNAFVEQALTAQALTPGNASGSEFSALIKTDVARWETSVKKENIRR